MIDEDERRGLRHWTVIASMVAIALGLSLALIGVTIWIFVAAVIAPWFIRLLQRYGASIAVPVTAMFATLILLLALTAASTIPVPLFVTLVTVLGLSGAGGVFALAWMPVVSDRSATGRRAVWLAPFAGVSVWAAVMVASLYVPGAARYSWIMMGDAANNLLFAREVIYSNGVAIGPGENPVPLPAGLIATGVTAGRDALPSAGLVQHDIAGFTLVWALVIGALCYAIGAAAAATIPRDRSVVAAGVAGAASLLPLSWFVTGYPLEFGFFNAHLSLIFIFLSWVVSYSAHRAPWLVLSTLFAACTLQLAVWSPFILIPIALGVVVIIRHWRDLLDTRGTKLAVLLVTFLQLVAYGVFITLPSLLALSSALSAQGGVYPFSRKMIIGVFVGGLIVAVGAFVMRRTLTGWLLFAMLAGLGLGQGALLFLNRDQASVWTYYPTKFAWMASIIALVVVVGVVAGISAQVIRRGAWIMPCLAALVGATLIILAWAPKAVPSYPWMYPAERIISGEFLVGGEATAEKIFMLSNPDSPHVLWNSNDPAESSINFWLLQLSADIAKGSDDLRVFAYGYYDLDQTEDLCAIVTLMGGGVTVNTADSSLESELSATCPEVPTSVELE